MLLLIEINRGSMAYTNKPKTRAECTETLKSSYLKKIIDNVNKYVPNRYLGTRYSDYPEGQ